MAKITTTISAEFSIQAMAGTAKCHDQAQAAHLPGKHLQARGEGAERQQA